MHVFHHAGLRELRSSQKCRLLEVGVGTGLNLLLAAKYAVETAIPMNYTGLEPFPVAASQIKSLNYSDFVGQGLFEDFADHYDALIAGQQWSLGTFDACIQTQMLLDFKSLEQFDLIFYDAFSPTSQQSMWEPSSLAKVADLLAPGGRLVTYCIRGYIKRQFLDLGLQVEKLPGPPGKREMMRITKPSYV
jgi:tRNA U34 5-methylaminomethyl-2-thiouridine-forming methyltransferase MnmC